MKKLILSIGLALALSGFAHAKTPPEVLEPYKAYRAAVDAGDAELARKHAYAAWQKAEELMGDTKTTGDLAINFANIAADKSKSSRKNRERAFERSLELVSFYGDDAASSYMERGVGLMNFHQVNNNRWAAFKLAKDLEKYAEENGVTTSTFYGEALTQQAGYFAGKGNNRKAEAVAKKALEAFANKDDNIRTVHPILANLYNGYGLEGQEKSVEAALSYQKVMESLDGIGPDEHPLAAKALGRWSHMRAVLRRQGKLEEAEEKGLCRCWPYDKPRNESLKPVKRVPPKMPGNAYVSGFSIVQFDLDDAGSPINTEILVSWPKGLYEKSSLKSMKGWEYTERTEKETDADRQELITTIRYMLTDRSGDIIY